MLIKAYFFDLYTEDTFANWSRQFKTCLQKEVSDDAKCHSVFRSSHDLVYLQNSSLFPKLILVKTDHPAYTHCWSSRGIQGHWPSSFMCHILLICSIVTVWSLKPKPSLRVHVLLQNSKASHAPARCTCAGPILTMTVALMWRHMTSWWRCLIIRRGRCIVAVSWTVLWRLCYQDGKAFGF